MRLPLGLIEDISQKRCVPFLGSGYSKNCRVPEGINVPLWDELIRVMCTALGKGFDDLPNDVQAYLDVAQEYENEFGRIKLVKLYISLIPIKLMQPGYVHKMLAEFFKFPIYITTNYDNLIEKTQLAYGITARVIASNFQLQIHEDEPDTVKVIKMHGDFENPEALVINKYDYEHFFTNNETIADYVKNIFRSKSVLLMGYSGIDPDYQQIVEYRNRLGNFSNKLYILQMDPNTTDNTVATLENNIVELRMGIKDRTREGAIIYFLRCLFNAVARYESGSSVYGEPTISENNKLVIPSIYHQYEGATSEEIHSLSLFYNSPIPNSLEVFLAYGNGGEFIFKDEDGDDEYEFLNIREMLRHQLSHEYNKFLIPFYAVGNGDYWCLNLHDFQKWDECSVVYWSHYPMGIKRTNMLFYEWLKRPRFDFFREGKLEQ